MSVYTLFCMGFVNSNLLREHVAVSLPGFSFLCSASEGAILTLPDGASRLDYRGLGRFREYGSENAESWYRYINGPRAREAENGSIYLITGCDKTRSWGVASFANVSNSFALTFTAIVAGETNVDSTFSWADAGLAATNSGPVPIEYFDGDAERPPNQCTFVRGFKISLSRSLWAGLRGWKAGVSSIVDVKPGDVLSRNSSVPFGSGSSWFGGLLSIPGSQNSATHQKHSEGMASDDAGAFVPKQGVVITSDFHPVSYVSAKFKTVTVVPHYYQAVIPPVKCNK
jgi:hypothetical protein